MDCRSLQLLHQIYFGLLRFMEVLGTLEATKSFIFISNVSDIIASCSISKGFRYRQWLFLYSILLTEVSLLHEELLLHFPNLRALSCFHLNLHPLSIWKWCRNVLPSGSQYIYLELYYKNIRVTMLGQVRGPFAQFTGHTFSSLPRSATWKRSRGMSKRTWFKGIQEALKTV